MSGNCSKKWRGRPLVRRSRLRFCKEEYASISRIGSSSSNQSAAQSLQPSLPPSSSYTLYNPPSLHPTIPPSHPHNPTTQPLSHSTPNTPQQSANFHPPFSTPLHSPFYKPQSPIPPSTPTNPQTPKSPAPNPTSKRL